MSEPLVTVCILAFNRKNDVDNTLSKVFEQNYRSIEVILVDNASSDGTGDMVREKYPMVILMELKENIGIAGWNEGLKKASGKYVLILDDNAYPHEDAVTNAVKIFESDPSHRIAMVAFNIFDLRTEQLWDSRWLPGNRKLAGTMPIFVACAFMVDRSKVDVTSLMPPHYFLYQNELVIAAKIHNNGHVIHYSPDIIGYHWFFADNGYSKRKDRLIFQNNLFFIVESLPGTAVIPYVIQNLLFFLTRSIRYGWINEYRDTVSTVFRTFRRNNVIRWNYFLELRRLHIFNFSLLSKLKFYDRTGKS
ncbi:MAG: glycosyltransferase family 2 protein [Bacteroidota bacterium]